MIVQIFPDICPGKNEKTKKVDHLELDLGKRLFSIFQIYVQEKRKKVDHLELYLTSFVSIRVDINQIVHIFPNICPAKDEKRKNGKSGSSGARFGQTIIQTFPDICPVHHEKTIKRKKMDHLELDLGRWLVRFFQIHVQEKRKNETKRKKWIIWSSSWTDDCSDFSRYMSRKKRKNGKSKKSGSGA